MSLENNAATRLLKLPIVLVAFLVLLAVYICGKKWYDKLKPTKFWKWIDNFIG